MQQPPNSSRRQFLGLAGGAAVLGAVPVVTVRPAEATPAMLASAIQQRHRRRARCRTGKVKLDIPPLVENGNTVPMTVSVNQPDGAGRSRHEHPRLQRKESAANIANFHLGPHTGRAQVSTRIRLADSQKIVAIAKLSDGSFWSASVDVVVTLAACTEEVI